MKYLHFMVYSFNNEKIKALIEVQLLKWTFYIKQILKMSWKNKSWISHQSAYLGGGELKCDKSLALGLYTKHLFMQRRANISDHKNANRDRSTKL